MLKGSLSGSRTRSTYYGKSASRATAEAKNRRYAHSLQDPVSRAARDHEARFSAAFRSAARQGQMVLDVAQLTADLERREPSWAESTLGFAIAALGVTLKERARELVRSTLVAGAKAATQDAQRRGQFERTRIRAAQGLEGLIFDQANPEAVAWASTQSAQLVTRVTEETRAALRSTMAQAFIEGWPPEIAARMLRTMVGLTGPQTTAVANLRAKMLDPANAGHRIFAGKTAIRIPKTGVTEELIARRTEQYANRLLNLRGRMIARTETIAASNEGQRQLWIQAQQEGLLGSNQVKEWFVTPDERLCPICEPLNGLTALIDQPFPDIGIQGPPAHVFCRCTMGISTKGLTT